MAEKLDPIRVNFGLRLKAAREGSNMTQEFVADAFGVGKGTVSAWETGRGDPGAIRLRRLAKMYSVSADALLWEDSITPAAMRIAAQYDAMSDKLRQKFDVLWQSHFVDAVSDEEMNQHLMRSGSKQHIVHEELTQYIVSIPEKTGLKKK